MPTLALGTFLHCSAPLVHFNILPFFVTHSSTAPCQACSDHCFLPHALILQCSALKYCLLLNVEHFSGVRCSCGAHKAGGAGARRGLATGPYKVNHFCQQAKLFQIIAVNQNFIANYPGKNYFKILCKTARSNSAISTKRKKNNRERFNTLTKSSKLILGSCAAVPCQQRPIEIILGSDVCSTNSGPGFF